MTTSGRGSQRRRRGSQRRWDVWGAAGGVALGSLDTGLLTWLGVDFQLAGRDATLAVGAFFTTSFALLGYAIGALARARARSREDATTIARQLAALEESQRALIQHEKLAAIGRLAAGVAHEVRNPLSVIRASASMVRESFEPGEEPHRACEFIVAETDRLNALITSLLTFARPTEPRLQAASVEKLVDRALHLASERLRESAVDVERVAEGAIPEVRADPDLMAQVILDLVVNAIESIDAIESVASGGRVLIRLRTDSREVAIDVADDGPGIEPAHAAQVFEPFFTTKPSGTGLGLAMAARIVESHQGALELVSGAGAAAGGGGACFRIRLPVAVYASEEEAR
jgi:two-component system sensor histidine kinase HydH